MLNREGLYIIEISNLNKAELAALIKENAEDVSPGILETACIMRERNYSNKVYMRGLIELTNYCRNDCFYCGIRRSSGHIKRYALTEEQILDCCKKGYELGFRTFVLQGGENPRFNTKYMLGIISSIRNRFSDCAITLSLGEYSRETYQNYFNAGANRYLLRHETASPEHYEKLHPAGMTLENRKRCLYDIKDIGFQVGTGFMVGSPYQTYDDLAEDLLFIKEFKPHMVGIGPFIPAHSTPFENFPAGSLNLTILMMALTRILLPDVLLPSTTALGTIHPEGREMGLKAGGNVVMPNLSPVGVRGDYALYDNKIYTGEEAAESVQRLEARINAAGFEVSMKRGDHCGCV